MATKPPPPEQPNTGDTRRSTPENATRRISPPQPPTERIAQTRMIEPAPNIPPPPNVPGRSPAGLPRRPQRKPTRGGPLPPLWACSLMLLIVVVIVAGVVMLILSLGGQAAPVSTPRVLVTPYNPSLVIAQGTPPQLLATATIPPEFDAGVEAPAGQLALIGPTLPSPVLSPTPSNVAVGSLVRAVQGVNVRLDAGINNPVRFVADASEQFRVIDGPQQVDGLIWWQIQSPNDASRVGWAAENDGTSDLLEVLQEQPQ